MGQEELQKVETYKSVDVSEATGKAETPAEVPDSFKLKNLKSDTSQAKKMTKTELEEYKNALEKEKLKTEIEIAEIKVRKGEKIPVTPTPKDENQASPSLSVENTNYRVQFYSSGQQMSTNSPKFKGMDQIFEYQDKGLYKYTTGMFSTFAEALKFQGLVRKAGFSDAFVIGFSNGKRISVDDAKKILGK